MAFTIFSASAEERVSALQTNAGPDAPSVTKLAGGGWLVTWTARPVAGTGVDVFQQKYDADGEPQFKDQSGRPQVRQVNVETGADHVIPSVRILADGGWIVTWTAFTGPEGANHDIYQQRFNAAGEPQFKDQGGRQQDRLVSAGTAGDPDHNPTVTALPAGDGGWIVAWIGRNQDGSSGVYQQRYGADGEPLFKDGTGEPQAQQVEPFAYAAVSRPSVTTLADGGWIVTWAGAKQDGRPGINQQWYDKNGVPQFTDGNGQPQGRPVSSSSDGGPYAPSVAALADGGWLVTWVLVNVGGSTIYQQRYDKNGEALFKDGGGQPQDRVVNVYSNHTQNNPVVTALADGGWVVTWGSRGQDETVHSIYQQKYDSAGNPQFTNQDGAPLDWRATVPAAHDRFRQATTALDDGGWVVTSVGANGIDHAIYQTRYASAEFLGATADSAIGTSADEVLKTRAGGLSAGDLLDGRAGTDTIEMISAGLLDLRAPTTLANFEILRGSAGDDRFVVDRARLSAFKTYDGGAGSDALVLVGRSFDLTGIAVTNVEAVELFDPAGTHLTLDDHDTALLVRGPNGLDDHVTLVRGVFQWPERGALFKAGIETVTDDTGTYTNAAPKGLSLTGSTVQELSPNLTSVGALAVDDKDLGDRFTYTLVDNAGGLFRIVYRSGVPHLGVANGVGLDYEQASAHKVVVRVEDIGGLTFEKSFTITVTDLAPEVGIGGIRDDRMIGGIGADRFDGGEGNDTLSGASGNDWLKGGLGLDRLSGGKERDIFVFDTTPNRSTNVDTIIDFNVRDDSIHLDNAIFKALGKGGTPMKPVAMKAGYFHAGKAAHDANDRIVYDKKTGALFYDADGTGKTAQVKFATLTNKPVLKATDFFVI